MKFGNSRGTDETSASIGKGCRQAVMCSLKICTESRDFIPILASIFQLRKPHYREAQDISPNRLIGTEYVRLYTCRSLGAPPNSQVPTPG